LALALAFATQTAHAYSSVPGVDPKNGSDDVETKQVMKTAVAGESSSVSKGNILSYASAADGYSVSRISSGGASDHNRIACIAKEDIATGDVGYRRCVVKGFINYLKYDATLPITVFNTLCVNAEGVAVACAASYGATRNTGIIALETKASGTGTMKAMIQLR
jgi:hypothetical protein